MIPEPFQSIVNKRYDQFLKDKDKIDDKKLKLYFDTCFEDICFHFGLHACWICVNCMKKNILTYDWGEKPDSCPKCSERTTYAVGTFQAWASKTGDMFEWAFYHLIKKISDLPIEHKDTTMYDFEITSKIVVEAKGSAEYVISPDGTKYYLGRPGMKRSDSEKKAFANGEKYKNQHPKNKFFIVTNAVPENLTVKGRAADGLFNVTKKEDLDKFIGECKKNKSNNLSSFY